MAPARNLQAAMLALALFVGCTQIKPVSVPDQVLVTPQLFSHEVFDRVLQRFVDHQGLVDYAGLKNDPRDLDRYYLLLSTYSPDSHPALFPTVESKLAYWVNAYNAAAIKIVLSHYAISSVKDIKPPFPFFFLSNKSGFFVFQRVTFGGRTMNLYYLENAVIRERFIEPRIHFALNCAARGCPRLPNRAFTAEHLDKELDHETRRFLAENRNFRVDHQEKTIRLSAIFQWYRDDFLYWYRQMFPKKKATLISYVALYLSSEEAAKLKSSGASYRVSFIPYDWRLNDKNEPPKSTEARKGYSSLDL